MTLQRKYKSSNPNNNDNAQGIKRNYKNEFYLNKNQNTT